MVSGLRGSEPLNHGPTLVALCMVRGAVFVLRECMFVCVVGCAASMFFAFLVHVGFSSCMSPLSLCHMAPCACACVFCCVFPLVWWLLRQVGFRMTPRFCAKRPLICTG